jgi:hypothetical protein
MFGFALLQWFAFPYAFYEIKAMSQAPLARPFEMGGMRNGCTFLEFSLLLLSFLFCECVFFCCYFCCLFYFVVQESLVSCGFVCPFIRFSISHSCRSCHAQHRARAQSEGLGCGDCGFIRSQEAEGIHEEGAQEEEGGRGIGR